ncbi:MAG: hypothetical protein AABX93_03065 [Nanoarchaeota archaeon]
MKIFALTVFLLLFFSSVSAEIIITQQPNPVYNYGDGITVPVIVKSTTDISGTLDMNLICNGVEKNFFKTDFLILAGEEKKYDGFVIFSREKIATPSFCKVKTIIGSSYATTNEFKVSDLINIELLTNKTNYNPEENIVIDGVATKENGVLADGFVDLIFFPENASQNITYKGTLNDGFFSVNFNLPKETRASGYSLKINAYEKNSEDVVINNGYANYDFDVNQVPTNLEVILDSSEIEPGKNVRIKTILHDQTGERISSTSVISIKDSFNEVREQTEKSTGDEFWEYSTAYNEAPSSWDVVAISDGITGTSRFKIIEKETADIKIINSTLVITNKGNVPYNESLTVKIDYEPVKFDVFLDIDETRRYVLNAPDGNYYVEVVGGGEKRASETVSLTGNAVSVREASGAISLTQYPLAWIFVILVLGFMFTMVLRKGYQKSFFGYITSPRRERAVQLHMPISRKEEISLRSKNRAELSLSLKGDKESSSLILLRIKNSDEIEGAEAEKILQQAIDFAEDNKAIAYLSEGYKNIMFILAPLTTKTFKNEKAAIEIAQKINEALQKYNKLAKVKINYGISLNSGDLVVRKDGSVLKFMSFGNSMNVSKKFASLANCEILLTDEARQRVFADRPVDRQTRNGTDVYILKEPKFKGDATKFIDNFKRRLDKDKY